MADTKAGPSVAEPAPTAAEYKKTQQRVREMVEKRRAIERRLNQVEDDIAGKEQAYLDSTPSGNIITGFDNYMKGTASAAAQRRKLVTTEHNRVFTRSSMSYRPSTGETPGSTPTPSVVGGGGNGSAGATPTSAVGGGGGGGGSKGKKKQTKNEEESDVDGGSKKRTNFGAARK